MVKHFITYFASAKGVTIATVTLAIIHSGLPPFVQALIIALVSATVGALGMILSAIISSRHTQQILANQHDLAQQISDTAGAVGANKRAGDPSPSPIAAVSTRHLHGDGDAGGPPTQG